MRTKEDICPVCGYEVDSATCPADPAAKPREGDLSVCLKCASPLVFNKDLNLKVITEEELVNLNAENVLAELRDIILAIKSTWQ
jgi:hypothetical protein